MEDFVQQYRDPFPKFQRILLTCGTARDIYIDACRQTAAGQIIIISPWQILSTRKVAMHWACVQDTCCQHSFRHAPLTRDPHAVLQNQLYKLCRFWKDSNSPKNIHTLEVEPVTLTGCVMIHPSNCWTLQ